VLVRGSWMWHGAGVMAAPAVSSDPLATSLAAGPAWWLLALLTGFALGLTWLLQQVGRARAFVVVWRWIPIVQVSVWALVVAVWLRRLIPDEGSHGMAGAIAVVLVALAGLPWLRNLFHAVVFGLENRYRLGDDLRVGDVEGRLSAVGPRAIVLRALDGTEITIPHAVLAQQHVVRLNLDVRDAPCELVLSAPLEPDPRVVVERARIAAALSPYAAPRCAPEVLLVTDGPPGVLRLRVRGFVFDREHAPRFRSDVSARFLAMAGEPGEPGEPEAARDPGPPRVAP
jgi:Mechanosensitive ion channel